MPLFQTFRDSLYRMQTLLQAFAVVCGSLLSFPAAGQAELFAGLHGGWAKPLGTDVSASTQTCLTITCTPAAATARSVGFRSAVSAGLRVGYWLERFPLTGVAGDVSYYQARGTGVIVEAIPLTTLVLFRLPLFPGEGLRGETFAPYLAIGPSAVVQRASVDFRPTLSSTVSGWALAPGWDARAGFSWLSHHGFRCSANGDSLSSASWSRIRHSSIWEPRTESPRP